VKTVPLGIDDAPPLLEVRGELYMARSTFAELNEQRAAAGESTFANPRNAAAGSIRQLDPEVARSRPLSMWCYSVGANRGIDFTEHYDSLVWLKEHGFKVNPEIELHDDIEAVVATCRGWEERREKLDYETDGVVVKVNDLALQRRSRAARGDRVEVRTDDRHHDPAQGDVERRPHRTHGPVREPRAGAGLGCDCEARDAPQRGGPEA
jgi:DNA ligase (NAD+)